ncbi:hypothetical protein cypCar_00030569, partial [Cyprinus carpio]
MSPNNGEGGIWDRAKHGITQRTFELSFLLKVNKHQGDVYALPPASGLPLAGPLYTQACLGLGDGQPPSLSLTPSTLTTVLGKARGSLTLSCMGRPSGYQGGPHMLGMGPGGPYNHPPSNSSARMIPQGPSYNTMPTAQELGVGPMTGSGDSMMPTDLKKEEGSTPITEPPKPKDNYGSQCVSQPPTPSPLSPSPASLSSYQGDD